MQGIQFMHLQHVAHRSVGLPQLQPCHIRRDVLRSDCQSPNIMMDPRNMFPKMYHPVANLRSRDFKGYAKHYTRTVRPTRYYITAFGLSRRYSPEDKKPLERIIRGGDRTAPEFKGDVTIPIDPLPTDVYYLGNMIRMSFMEVHTAHRVLAPMLTLCLLDIHEFRLSEAVGQRHGCQ